MGFRLDLGVFPVRHSSWKREHLRFLPFDEVVCAGVLCGVPFRSSTSTSTIKSTSTSTLLIHSN